MSLADEDREKAATLAAMAEATRDPARRAQCLTLSRSYLLLALQADKNAATDVVYETPVQRPVVVELQQQQQKQRQPKKKPKA